MKTILLTISLLSGIHFGFSQDKPAPDYLLNQKFPDSVMQFKMHNIQSENVTFQEVLKKHKGKKVVIDVWASWCKDCLESLPNLKVLQKETQANDVDYVFLSIDKTEERWKKAIEKLEIKGDHYFMSTGRTNSLTNYIDVDWIPRYLILNEDGKIILPKAVKVSGFENNLVVKD